MGRSERFSNEREILREFEKYATGIVVREKGEEYLVEGSEGHSIILGASGMGKTRRVLIPTTKRILQSDENAIILDSKEGEVLKHTKKYIGKNRRLIVVNYKDLVSMCNSCYNPLAYPYELWKTGEKKNKARAQEEVDNLSHVLYPIGNQNDPFWITSARNLFLAAVYTLFNYAEPEEVNLLSVFYLVQKGEERFGVSTYLKELVELGENNEDVSMQLYSYVSTANDTRSGIRSTFLEGVSVATKSEAIRDFISNDEIHIEELMGDKPFVIYIILPDDTPIYQNLAGIFVSQLISHFIYMADTMWNGKLPRRINLCIEELGNIGRAIPKLDFLLSAGRSRNIRVHMSFQSLSQLDDIYGKSKASTILSNVSVKIAFRTNDWDTLTELSRSCGDKEECIDGKERKQPLITPTQLGAMDVGQALVMVNGRIKFVSWLPDFTEVYNEDLSNQEEVAVTRTFKKAKIFDVKKFVKEYKRKAMLEASSKPERETTEIPFSHGVPPFIPKPFSDEEKHELEDRVNKKLAEFEAKKKSEKDIPTKPTTKKEGENKRPRKSSTVVVIHPKNKMEIIKVLRECMGWGLKEAHELYMSGKQGDIVELKGFSIANARMIKSKLEKIGNLVILKE